MLTTNDHAEVILVVDDNPTNLEILSSALIHVGYEIAIATDGESAIEQVNYDPPALILLDVMMPGLDGFETCHRLKQNPVTQDIPIIFMTALTDAKDKVRGLNLGAVDYITKPFQQEEVLARVRLQLKLRQMTRTLAQRNVQLNEEVEERKAAEVALQQLNQHLEQRVAERTAELSRTLQRLQQSQLQLVQSEKLSSLGQLVAGVAHEINNPVNFINGNITHITDYTNSLLDFVYLFQTTYPEPVSAIQQHFDSIDLPFIVEDLPKLLSSMKLGVDRIRQIVLSLRNFSRLDEAELKPVNIHEGIDSTLLILQGRFKARADHRGIQVVKEYGQLPLVECYAGQLNQVFMNLLSNAIDALEEPALCLSGVGAGKNGHASSPPYHPHAITIRTETLGADFIVVRIIDNGPGIPESVRQRLFDPFFTTKPAGKGTGLGLSISHQIITEKHHGEIWCQSEIGQGTEFCFKLPLRQNR